MEIQENVNLQNPAPESAAPAPAQVTDIDGLSEFTFQGEKFTPDRLAQVYSEYRNLSESQKSYAQEQKFLENIEADLDHVIKDPGLAQKFKELYPKKFHGLVDRVLRTGQASAQPSNAQPSLPPEVQARLDQMSQRLQFFEDRNYQAEVNVATSQIDKITEPLFQKYPLANAYEVFSRAEGMSAAKQKITDKTWERLIRENHETEEKKFDQHQGAKLKQQIEKGRRGADTGPGGSAPGQAPRKARTIGEATEEMLKHLQHQGA